MKNSNKINITLVILAVLIFVFGGYVLFFKGKGNPSIANEKITKEAIEFKSIARGEYGNLYLDLDGKVYFEPFSILIKSNTLQTVIQSFNTKKNNVYNKETLDAILLNIVNVDFIRYVVEDNSQNDYYLLIQRDGTRYLINNVEIILKGIINPVEDIENNNDLSDLKNVFMFNVGKNGANVEKIIGEDETPDILIGIVAQNSSKKISIYEKRDGEIYIKRGDGEEEKLTDETKKELSSEEKNYVEKIEEYVEKKYGKDLEKLPPKNNIVQIKNNEHVSKAIMDKYGKKVSADFPSNESTYVCSCGSYTGFRMASEENVCRDVLGYACWTKDEGYINPYLRPNWDGTRVDVSAKVEFTEQQRKEQIEELKKSKEKKRWFWSNGSLTISDIGSMLKDEKSALVRKSVDGTVAGMDCLGTYDECLTYMQNHKSELNLTDSEIKSIFEAGRKEDYPNPKDYHVSESSTTPKTTAEPSGGCDQSDRNDCYGVWNESTCSCTNPTPQATVKPTPSASPKPSTTPSPKPTPKATVTPTPSTLIIGPSEQA